jgi:hypothetical protein
MLCMVLLAAVACTRHRFRAPPPRPRHRPSLCIRECVGCERLAMIALPVCHGHVYALQREFEAPLLRQPVAPPLCARAGVLPRLRYSGANDTVGASAPPPVDPPSPFVEVCGTPHSWCRCHVVVLPTAACVSDARPAINIASQHLPRRDLQSQRAALVLLYVLLAGFASAISAARCRVARGCGVRHCATPRGRSALRAFTVTRTRWRVEPPVCVCCKHTAGNRLVNVCTAGRS